MYYKPQCLLFSYDQTMTIFKKKFLSLFYIETYHLLSISLFFAVANMASELSFFFMSDFYPRHKNFFYT